MEIVMTALFIGALFSIAVTPWIILYKLTGIKGRLQFIESEVSYLIDSLEGENPDDDPGGEELLEYSNVVAIGHKAA